jgi:nitrogen regulatory protein PII
MGCGKQNGYKGFVNRTEIAITMFPKIKIETIVSSGKREQKTIKGVQKVACTCKSGDGRIFRRNVMRVRTGETKISAIK